MKKIAFLIESLNLGGAETSLVTFLNNLDYTKYEVDLYLFTKENYFLKYIPKNVNVIFINPASLSFVERLKYRLLKKLKGKKFHNAQLFWNIVKDKFYIVNKEYDVVHAYNQGFVTYFCDKYIKSEKKYAWINIDYQKVNYDISFDYSFYKNYTKVIAISTEVKRGFEEELNKINKNVDIDIIKLFVDDKLVHSQSIEKLDTVFDSNKINIVTVCRLTKQKGLHFAVESCKKLIDKNYSIHWYVVGEGIERPFLENLIEINGLKDHFTLIGVKENPFPYVKACDIYVQTSIFEGLGLTVVEASLLHKPIVCTNFPTAYEILRNDQTGFIVEMNSDDISNAVQKLIEQPDLRTRFHDTLSVQPNPDKQESINRIDKLMMNS